MIGGEDTSGRARAFEETCAGVVGRLRARRSEIDQVIFARVRDVMPDAVALDDPEYVAGLRAAISAAVDFALTGLEQGRRSFPRVPSAAVAQARRAARAGVGLDILLRRYVVGHAILEDFLMQEADHSDLLGQRIALRGVLEASAALLDRLIPSVTDAYMRELEQAGSLPRRREDVLAPKRGTPSSYGLSATADSVGSSTSPEQVAQEQRMGKVAQEQRARILQALVEVLAERGFAGATVGLVVARARVSRRTFYELFAGLEDCLVVIMDRVFEQVSALVSRELEGAEHWRDGVRSALAAVLVFFDSEPELARVCIVETLAGGSVVLEHRERIVEAFSLPVLARIERETPPVSPLAAEGVMSLVLGIMHAHIVARKPGPLIELLGLLMGLATAPYMGARRVEREIERGDELARAILTGDSRWTPPRQEDAEQDAGRGLGTAFPAMLGTPNARRGRECLLFLAAHPDSSNREVAVGIDVAHQSQISKLLAYLCQEGLVAKRSEGAGKRNAWRLTPHGREVTRALARRAG